jgi:3-keto-5-aminohexanoate cleavage enzyme
VDKVIITCAVTGSRITTEQTPYIPIMPQEIIDSAVEAHQAGAAVVHIHVRDRESHLGTQDVDLFREVTMGIKARCDVIQCLTTSGIPGRNLSESDRIAPLALNPELASVDLGSMNFGRLPYIVTEEFIERELKEMLERNIKPELEVFDLGMLETCRRFIKNNSVLSPYYIGLVLGTPSGAPANVKILNAMVDLLPSNSIWFATGIGKNSLDIAVEAMLRGGHPRVGMEDSIYFSAGVLAQSNSELVARVVRIAKELGKKIATSDEARHMLCLK